MSERLVLGKLNGPRKFINSWNRADDHSDRPSLHYTAKIDEKLRGILSSLQASGISGGVPISGSSPFDRIKPQPRSIGGNLQRDWEVQIISSLSDDRNRKPAC